MDGKVFVKCEWMNTQMRNEVCRKGGGAVWMDCAFFPEVSVKRDNWRGPSRGCEPDCVSAHHRSRELCRSSWSADYKTQLLRAQVVVSAGDLWLRRDKPHS